MTRAVAQTQLMDRMAIGLSGLCIVHCLATAVTFGLLASFSHMLGAPWIHEVGLSIAMVLGGFALGRGAAEHGFLLPVAVGSLGLGVMAGALTLPHDGTESLCTVIGVAILALGHRLNSLAAE